MAYLYSDDVLPIHAEVKCVCVCASSHVSLHLLALTFNLVGSSRSSNLGPEYESRQQFCSHARTLIRRATFFYNSFRIEHDVQSMLL